MMKRTLLSLPILLGILILASSPSARAACGSEPYCDSHCPTAPQFDTCCCPAGTPAVGQLTTCRKIALCQEPCWGQPPGCTRLRELGELWASSSQLQCRASDTTQHPKQPRKEETVQENSSS